MHPTHTVLINVNALQVAFDSKTRTT